MQNLTKNNRGCGLLSAILGALIISIVMLSAMRVLTAIVVQNRKMEGFLLRAEKIEATQHCKASINCKGVPILCLTDKSQNWVVTCTETDPCTYTGGEWIGGSPAKKCTSGVLVKFST